MRKVFFVILPVMVLLLCSGLMAVDIVVGNGNQQAPRPIDLGWRFSLFQTLYYPSELNQGGYINSISFYSTMQAAMPQVGIQLYLGVTSVDDLSGGWIPASQLTQVYSGTYNFVAGYNQMQLNLSTPFLYSGGNLVLMAKMPQNLYFSQSQMFNCQTVGSTRARFVHSDTQDYNPNIPPTPTAGQLSGLFPKTMFSFSDVPLQHDIAVVSLSVNPPYILGIMTNFNVSYTNLGSSSEADYTIKIYNSLQQEVASVTGAPILPNQTLNAVISWTPVAEGYHEFTAKIVLNSDMNPFNNISLPDTVIVVNSFIYIDPPATGQYRVPIDFYWRSTLYEMILLPTMVLGLGLYSNGFINCLQLHKNFTDTTSPISFKIWMGETSQTDLTSGWIPSGQLNLVFDGTMTFPAGTYREYINLQNAYYYRGGNLVIMFFRPIPADYWFSGTDNFFGYQTTNNTFRKLYTDSSTINPNNPPATAGSLINYYPKITFEPKYSNFGTIRGNVINHLNQPGAGASVQIQPYGLITIADESGNFAFPWLPPGTYNVTVSIDNTTLTQTQTVNVSAQQVTTQFFDFYIASNWGSLSGDVLNTSNQPVSGAVVQIAGAGLSTTTDANGYYSFPAVPAGSYPVIASAAGYLSQTIMVQIMATQQIVTNFTLQLISNVTISGRVVNSALTTEYIASAIVDLSGPGFASAVTNAQGYFQLPDIPILNNYLLTITASGFETLFQGVTTVYDNIDLGNIPLTEILLCPYNVQAEPAAAPEVCHITWSPPYTGDGELIHYDSGYSGMGMMLFDGTGAPLPMDVAIRFSTEDLAPYVGMSLMQVRFYARSATSEHRVRVYTGGTIGNSGNMLVDIPVLGHITNAWNTLNLPDPVLITGDEELWIGMHYSPSSVAPASCDNGPLHDWQGNLLYTGTGWITIYSLVAGFENNWNIRGLLNVDSTGNRQQLTPLTRQQVAYNKVFIMKEQGNAAIESLQDEAPINNDRSFHGYKVWRLSTEQQNDPSQWTLLTPNTINGTYLFDLVPLPFLGSINYRWAVKAVYSGEQYSNPAFSPVLEFGTPAGMLKGMITNAATGQPLSYAVIWTDANPDEIICDPTGYYQIIMPPGTYTIHCMAGNFFLFQQQNVVITNGDTTMVDIAMTPDTHTPEVPEVILATALKGTYPNPFRAGADIRYDLKDNAVTTLEIYNLKGQKVKTLLDGFTKSGRYTTAWNGTDEQGKSVAEGIYFCRLQSGGSRFVCKLVKIR